MQWMWTSSGDCFGYRRGDELWTYDGRHVGRFEGNEIFDRHGRYLGEAVAGDWLAKHRSKDRRRGSSFTPRTRDSGAAAPRPAVARHLIYAGYEDFPPADAIP